jgi:hypothetical protein
MHGKIKSVDFYSRAKSCILMDYETAMHRDAFKEHAIFLHMRNTVKSFDMQ